MRTIGGVLAGLSAIGILMAGLILGSAMWAEHRGGTAVQMTFVSKDVTADILPPPMYLLEMRLVLSQAAEGSLPQEKAEAEVQRLEKEYLDRVDYWTKNPPYGLEVQLLGTQHDTSIKFIAAMREALKVTAAANADETRKAVQKAHTAYLAHRAAVDDTVKASSDFATGTLSTYQSTRSAMTTLELAIFVLALVVLSVAAVWVNRRVTLPIKQAVELAETVARGDLSGRIVVTREDETGQLLKALQAMTDNLRDLVTNVRGGIGAIATGSEKIASGNADLSQRTEAQVGLLEESASAMEQLNVNVQSNAESAHQASRLAAKASESVVRGGEMVNQVVNTMDDIAAASQKIGDIIAVIDGIAFQTNILALNAAVEAARAGEQGRGFAVVASEVRSLAQRSANAAKEIKALINSNVEKVETGSRLVSQTGATMTEIVQQVQSVSDRIGEISSASRQQTTGIAKVGIAVTQLDQGTQKNAALVEQTSTAADNLSQQTRRLVDVMNFFKT